MGRTVLVSGVGIGGIVATETMNVTRVEMTVGTETVSRWKDEATATIGGQS